MTLSAPVTDALVSVYRPGASEPHVQFSSTTGEVDSVGITRRLQHWTDRARIECSNVAAEKASAVETGHRIEVEVIYATTPLAGGTSYTSGGHGQGGFGTGGHGSGGTTHELGATNRELMRWVGVCDPPTLTVRGRGHLDLSLTATDFVFGIMGMRTVYDAYENHPVSTDGSPHVEEETPRAEWGMLNRILDERAPEIDRTGIEPSDVQTDREWMGRSLIDAAEALAESADAVMASEGTRLYFVPKDSIHVSFALAHSDFGTLRIERVDDDLVNDLRVDGGTGIDRDQVTLPDGETPASYARVDENNPIFYQLDPEKTTLDRVDVWTRRDPDSEDNLAVRVQRGARDGSGPTAPGDETKDIERDTSDHNFLSDDGWRNRFRFQREVLPEAPWLIIESNGATGHDIGLNADGDPAIRTWYPYPINVNLTDPESIERYRLRQNRTKEGALNTFSAALDAAESSLAHTRLPEQTLDLDAHSIRLFTTRPGDVLRVPSAEFGHLGIDGLFAVVEMDETFSAATNALNIDVTLQELESV